MIKKAIASGIKKTLPRFKSPLPKDRITPVYKPALPPMKKTPMPIKKMPIKQKFPAKPITRPMPVPKKVAQPMNYKSKGYKPSNGVGVGI